MHWPPTMAMALCETSRSGEVTTFPLALTQPIRHGVEDPVKHYRGSIRIPITWPPKPATVRIHRRPAGSRILQRHR